MKDELSMKENPRSIPPSVFQDGISVLLWHFHVSCSNVRLNIRSRWLIVSKPKIFNKYNADFNYPDKKYKTWNFKRVFSLIRLSLGGSKRLKFQQN